MPCANSKISLAFAVQITQNAKNVLMLSIFAIPSPKNQRVRVKAQVDEVMAVPQFLDIFPGALWFERETYDMYGVVFEGHPDMRRLLTDYGLKVTRFAKISRSRVL